MLAKLVNVETGVVIMRDKFADEEALAAENERAQEESRGQLEWRALTPFEIGVMTAHIAVLLGLSRNGTCGGNSDQQRHLTG